MRTQERPKKHVDIHSCIFNNGYGYDKRGKLVAFINNTPKANIRGMSLKSTLSPFLFLDKNGAYDGQTTYFE